MKRMLLKGWVLYVFLLILPAFSCDKDNPVIPPVEEEDEGDLTAINYSPQVYNIPRPLGFSVMPGVPPSNPTTVAGVELGRHLFYDTKLSSDGRMSCASCHLQNLNFTDGTAKSLGVTNQLGKRSAMSLLNIGYANRGLFWDGRVRTLEEQALIPVEDPVELHENWDNVVEKLKKDKNYPRMFREAFGITHRDSINKFWAARALAQFQRAMVSGNAKFDRVVYLNQEDFTESEARGYDMYFDISPNMPDAECAHCHNSPLFTSNQYFNNGITEVASLEDFPDKGLGAITGSRFDNGKFRAPSLRNIALTAPYMHDGRFKTLEEVIDHYNSGGHRIENTDPLIRVLGLTEQQKKDILNFLHTLTDTSFTSDPRFADPFK